LWKFRFTCPNAQGEGETRFAGDSAFTTTVRGLYDGREGSVESDARWLGEDCGNLPARGAWRTLAASSGAGVRYAGNLVGRGIGPAGGAGSHLWLQPPGVQSRPGGRGLVRHRG